MLVFRKLGQNLKDLASLFYRFCFW